MISFLFVGSFLLFLALKLLGQIDWSWWLVTAPLWGGFAGWCVLVLLSGVIAVALATREARKEPTPAAQLRREAARSRRR